MDGAQRPLRYSGVPGNVKAAGSIPRLRLAECRGVPDQNTSPLSTAVALAGLPLPPVYEKVCVRQ